MTKARFDKREGKKLGEILCALLIAVMGAGAYSACKSNIEGDDPTKGDRDEGGDDDMDVTNPNPDAQSAGKGGSGGVKPDAGAAGATNPPKDAAPGPVGACASPPLIKIIFDTDIGPDCDDAGAVAMLHTLADRCEIEIIGMMSATSYQFGAAALDAINTFYGRPDIPIGTLKDKGFLDSPNYSKDLAERFPNDLKSGANAPDAVDLFKDLLAKQPDKSVTIVSVGPLRNARNLIASPGGGSWWLKRSRSGPSWGGRIQTIFRENGTSSKTAQPRKKRSKIGPPPLCSAAAKWAAA